MSRLSVLILFSAIVVQGCIAIPIPTRETKVLAGTPLSTEQISFIKPNITTKEEVVRVLGTPTIIWEDAMLFTYNWTMRRGFLLWGWGMGGGGFAGGGGIENIPKHHAFIVTFDEFDRVQRSEFASWSWSKPFPEFLREWISEPNRSSSHEGLRQSSYR